MTTCGRVILAPFAYGEPNIALTSVTPSAPVFGFRPTPICHRCKRMTRLVTRNAHAEITSGNGAAIWACAVYECIRCGLRVFADFSAGPICQSTSASWDEWRRELIAADDYYMIEVTA